MKFFLSLVVFFSILFRSAEAQTAWLTTRMPGENPHVETRAVWLTTIGGIDWPHSYSQSAYTAGKQQEELRQILDRLAEANINTVLLQTRIRATTIFESPFEPWDGCLSGHPGQSPGYDALQFAIDECHRRGMKLHAWVVTIPIGKWNDAGCRNLRKTHPYLLKKIGDEGFMNPENSGTADYIAKFCSDIVSRYDIDGIHLDYIRYPDTWGRISDKKRGRDNITNIVRNVYGRIKAVKPWVQVSCSPVGKYADTRRQWSHGWNARDVVCQDVALWLKEGCMDAVYPMMYFKDENFYPFAIDWQERSCGKTISPGLGIYFMHPKEKNWRLSDITRELWTVRQYGMGNCMFRSKFFTDNTKGIYDYFKDSFATVPSLTPATDRLSDGKPHAPRSLTATQQGGNVTLTWEDDTTRPPHSVTYNVYGSAEASVDITKAENLLCANLQQCSIELGKTYHITHFAVTATDRYGSESLPATTDNDVETGSGKSPFLNYVGGEVMLDNADVQSNSPVVITTIFGNDCSYALVKELNGHKTARPAQLAVGNYSIYTINKKGHRHLIGHFSVRP